MDDVYVITVCILKWNRKDLPSLLKLFIKKNYFLYKIFKIIITLII